MSYSCEGGGFHEYRGAKKKHSINGKELKILVKSDATKDVRENNNTMVNPKEESILDMNSDNFNFNNLYLRENFDLEWSDGRKERLTEAKIYREGTLAPKYLYSLGQIINPTKNRNFLIKHLYFVLKWMVDLVMQSLIDLEFYYIMEQDHQ